MGTTRSAAAPTANSGRLQGAASSRKQSPAAAPGVRRLALDRQRDASLPRQLGGESSDRTCLSDGQLPARISAQMGRQDLLHTASYRSIERQERGSAIARTPRGRFVVAATQAAVSR